MLGALHRYLKKRAANAVKVKVQKTGKALKVSGHSVTGTDRVVWEYFLRRILVTPTAKAAFARGNVVTVTLPDEVVRY